MNDSIKGSNQYGDFKFVTEKSDGFGSPHLREVTYISAGWNFMILFAVMIMVVIGRFVNSHKIFYNVKSPFQHAGIDKSVRDTMSSSLLMYMLIVISSILLISMFLQKFLIIYGANRILYDNFSFYTDVVFAVSTLFVLNYLLMSFYAWMFNSRSLLMLHVNSHLSNLEMINIVLIPFLMVLFFYPYKSFCVICLLLIILSYVIYFINFIVEIRLLSKLNFINIFLYLCTLEIVPLLVIFKMIRIVFL